MILITVVFDSTSSVKSSCLNLVESFHCVRRTQSSPTTKAGCRSRSPGDDVTRNRLILGISVIVSLLLIFSALTLFREWKNRQARVDQRVPLQGLSYCDSNSVTPCVVSFSQDAEGNMLVNLLTAGAFYPDFYLTIKTEQTEYLYVCDKVNRFATSVYCTGKTLPVGVVYQFLIFSLNEEILLAQGSFPIIGMALVTPVVIAPPTPTPIPPTPTTVLPTDIVPRRTPSPSYPSYP